VLSKLPEYKPLAGCGACNECKDDFRAILPLEFRFCHGYSHCLPLHLRSLRLFSFDGNPAYVRLVQEGIRHFPRRPLEVLRLPQEWQNQTLEEIWKVELAAFSDDSTNKTTMFWVNGDELGKIVTKNETNKKLARVPLITIDEWRERDGIDHIDFIKIDTEGHDAKIIKGAKRTLFEKKITAMVFESGHMWPAEDTLEDITRMMEDYGYACYFDYSNGMVKLTHGCWANKYGEASKIWGNTLCVLSTNREGEMITRAFDQWSIQFN
jgi:FkbM family methyltransferase